jgi:antitoxin FitA
MPDLVIHNIDPDLDGRLRARAAARGRTAEDEARAILQTALIDQPREPLVELARELFGPEHGIELDLPRRPRAASPPNFE